MIYTYRYRVLEANGKITTDSEKIDASQWLDYLAAHSARYGNLDEFVRASAPALKDENPLLAADIVRQIEDSFATNEPTAALQYALYCWQARKAGELSAKAWGAILGYAWHAGERTMLSGVALQESLVIRMFEAADRETLFQVGASRQGWDDYHAALPEMLDIYRGISARSRHKADGFSWTTSPDAAKRYSGTCIEHEQDIPGVLHARVPKTALLACFEPDDEVIIHPGVDKQDLSENYLSGSGLDKFRSNWKKWHRAQQEEKIKNAQAH